MRKNTRNNYFVSCIAVLLACSMLICGCAGQETSTKMDASVQNPEETKGKDSAETAEGEKELTTIEIWGGGTAGEYEGTWWTEMLERDLGVKIQSLGGDPELLETYIAAQDLPDIIRIQEPEHFQLAYEAGLLVNLDEKKDLLPNVFEQYPEGALQFQRDKYADGGLYSLPLGATTYGKTYGGEEYATRIDFPYFLEYCEASGTPELKDIEDFIPVLKWIQEQHPVNENGQTTYGISFFPDWDGEYMGLANWMSNQFGVKQVGYNEINMDTLERVSTFDDNSYYKRMLKFLYEANQAGILDPDSMTQAYSDYTEKLTARRVYSIYCFGGNEFLKLIPFENQHNIDVTGAAQLGNSNGAWGLCVSATSENVDLACQLLNYLADEEALWELKLGPQGEYWDVNEEGQPYKTEFGYKMDEDPNVQFSNGGNIKDNGIGTWNWRTLANEHVYSQYGEMADPNSWATASRENMTETDKLYEDWIVESYGLERPDGVLCELDVTNVLADKAEIRNGATGKSPSDEMAELRSRLSAVVPGMCWQMIYASSEAEFESIWDSLTEQVTEMGIAELSDWYYEDYIAGVEGYDAYCY